MPQIDRHRNRNIPIEFVFFDTLTSLPYEDRISIILISSGSATLKINEQIIVVKSPSVLCISKYDSIGLINSKHLSAKTFSFDPWYIKACLTFENLNANIKIDTAQEHNRQMLYLFVNHKEYFQGVFELTPNHYLRINEILSFIGAETYAQSDRFWTCRIRRLLLQILNIIFDLFVDQRKLHFYEKPEQNNVSLCVNYIHSNYKNDITLSQLTSLVHSNRTTLNIQFKKQLNTTAMNYLLDYRIEIAKELLSNTNLKVSEISSACGFKYDTYFIKQFTQKVNQSPIEYRKFIWSQK